MLGKSGTIQRREYLHYLLCDKEPIIDMVRASIIDNDGNETNITLKSYKQVETTKGEAYEVTFLSPKLIV